MLPVDHIAGADAAEPGPVSYEVRVEQVHINHYEPWAGGPNCACFVGGECVSKMSSGEHWQDHIDKAAACPPEWDYGTRFRTPDGREWECLKTRRIPAVRCTLC